MWILLQVYKACPTPRLNWSSSSVPLGITSMIRYTWDRPGYNITTWIQNTAFCQKNESQSERICNKFQYSLRLRLWPHPPGYGVWFVGTL